MSRALDSAVTSLWTEPDGAQFALLSKFANRCLGRQGVPGSDREDITVKVIWRFCERARAGCDLPDHPGAYFYKSVCNAAKSYHRKRMRELQRHDHNVEVRDVPPAHANGRAPDTWLDADVPAMVWAFIDEYVELAKRASAAMPNARAEQFRASCAEMLDLKLGKRDFEQVLQNNGVTPGFDPGQRKRIVDRLQQRHKRARDALAKFVGGLEAKGELDADKAAAWRERIIRLRRRQNGGVPNVLTGEPVAPHVLALDVNEDDNE